VTAVVELFHLARGVDVVRAVSVEAVGALCGIARSFLDDANSRNDIKLARDKWEIHHATCANFDLKNCGGHIFFSFDEGWDEQDLIQKVEALHTCPTLRATTTCKPKHFDVRPQWFRRVGVINVQQFGSGRQHSMYVYVPKRGRGRPPNSKTSRNVRRRELAGEKRALSKAKADVQANPCGDTVTALLAASATKHGRTQDPELSNISAAKSVATAVYRNAVNLVKEMPDRSAFRSAFVGKLADGLSPSEKKQLANDTRLRLSYILRAGKELECSPAYNRMVTTVYTSDNRTGSSRLVPTFETALVQFFKRNTETFSGQVSATLNQVIPHWTMYCRLHAETPSLLRTVISSEPGLLVQAQRRLQAMNSVRFVRDRDIYITLPV
jgi:hypothetical protein